MADVKKISYLDLLKLRKFDYMKKGKPDNIHFVIQGTKVIGTSGNFISFSGLPKAGKSTFIAAVIASALSRKMIFDFNVFLFENKPRIALFDTEQSQYDFERGLKRIQQLAGIKDVHKNFDIFMLAEDNSNTIIRLVHAYLETNKDVGIIIIDGLLDLIDNMNDEGASKRLIRLLKKWAKIYDVLIITVLHLGKKENNTLGHLGSASDRYAQSTLKIERTKAGSLLCSPVFLRSAHTFEPIEIVYSEATKNYYQYEK